MSAAFIKSIFASPLLRANLLRVGFFSLGLIASLAPASLRAVVFLSTADPNFNTTAPTGALANSGWQWAGNWRGFQGTPIGPHHFIAAHHIGGNVGDPFVLNGVTYTTTAFTDDPASDLRIWQVSGTFPDWAPLYRKSDEVGRNLVVFGRGVIRGSDVQVTGGPYAGLKGWMWGPGDGRLRWGTNAVHAVIDGGTQWGALLQATFDQNSDPNQADLGTGDSSGPVFINDGTAWKLAGVAATVDSSFNTTSSGNGFIASLFDTRGLYYSPSPPNNWTLVVGMSPIPTAFYSTRISAHLAWIDGVVPPPDTGTDAPVASSGQLGLFAATLAGSGALALQRFRRTLPR